MIGWNRFDNNSKLFATLLIVFLFCFFATTFKISRCNRLNVNCGYTIYSCSFTFNLKTFTWLKFQLKFISISYLDLLLLWGEPKSFFAFRTNKRFSFANPVSFRIWMNSMENKNLCDNGINSYSIEWIYSIYWWYINRYRYVLFLCRISMNQN